MKLPNRGWLERNNLRGGWNLYVPSSTLNIEKQRKKIHAITGTIVSPIAIIPLEKNEAPNNEAIPVLLRLTPEKKLKVGPFFGILTVRENGQLRGNRSNFIDLLKTIQQLGGVGYVFTPDDIDWNRNLVTGLTFLSKEKGWRKERYPIPEVVYNRIPNRNLEQNPKVQETIHKLQKRASTYLFNPHFFNKGELFEILKHTSAKKYLPATHLLKTKEILQKMSDQYTTLYIKPIDGKAGDGIFRLDRTETNYLLHANGNGKRVTKVFTTTDDLWTYLNRFTQDRKYLIQEGIPLLTYSGSPFDARVLVQKNAQGAWEVSGIGVRVAGRHGITTHVPQGGSIIQPHKALIPYFGSEGTESLLEKIKKGAIEIAAALEKPYTHLGEMSMDLGITKEGEIWFFEANAKPMKFDEAEIRAVSLRRIIEYSQYLSSFLS